MAGTIQQLWNPVRKEHRHKQHKSRHNFSDLFCTFRRNGSVGSACPGFQYTVCGRSVWVGRRHHSSEGLRGELCTQREADKIIFDTFDDNGSDHSEGLRGELCTQRREADKIIFDTFDDNGSDHVALLRACAKRKDLHRGARVHEDILRRGLLNRCSNALATMYAKCGALTKAREMLVTPKSRDVYSWTALIAAYVQQGQSRDALDCFDCMLQEHLSPDAVTFACALKACGSLGEVYKGKQIHDEITRQGLLGNDMVLSTSLVDMYTKCGALEKAQQVHDRLPLRDVFTWSALITGYANHGQAEKALHSFKKMQDEGLDPDSLTFACILKACGSIGAAQMGEQIHDEVARQGLLRNNILLGTALVDMHAKCGALEKAQRVLEELVSRDAVAWNALLAGYAKLGQGEQVVSCFKHMQGEGLFPNAVTFSCMLNACSNLGLVDDGPMYFKLMRTRFGMQPDSEHYACMIDLFGRAGCIDMAVGVIEEMPSFAHFEVWCALLGACQKWGDVNVGRWAFEHAVKAEKSDVAAHVLLANVYSADARG